MFMAKFNFPFFIKDYQEFVEVKGGKNSIFDQVTIQKVRKFIKSI